MIALIGGLAIAVLVGLVVATFIGSVAGSKALGTLVGVALMPTLAFVPLAIGAVATSEPSWPTAMVAHGQLEADRMMTQQMAVAGGPGMEALMAANGMLERSSNTAYVTALEEHVRSVDRMIGRSP